MTVKVTNNGFSTLSAGITNSATTITLASGEGSRFPNPSSPDVFYATLIDTSNNLEIVKVTARSTDSLTVVRAQDNTSARAFSTGDRFELRPVAKLFEDIQAEARDLNGAELVLDADGDTSITADTDDRIDIRVGGTDVAYISSNSGQGALINRKTATPLIINGDMQIAQRGTSVTGTSSSQLLVDRFKMLISGLGTWDLSQSTDTPTGQGFNKSFKLDCTTADASPASTDNLAIVQRFEGQNLQMLKKGTSNAESVTLAFWVKSAKTGTYILELRDADNVRIICKTYTVDSANTWEKKVLSFAGDTTGALDNDNANSFHARWWLGAGSDYTSGTLSTSWEAQSNANRAVGQVNLADSTSNDWYITGVQLEVGTFDSNSIPPFPFEDRTTSFNRCSRYFYRQYSNAPYSVFANGFVSNSTTARVMQRFPQQRALPTISTNGSFQVIEGGSSRAVSSIASDNNSRSFEGTRLDIAITLGSAGNGCMLRASNDTDAYIEADSEL